MSDSPKAILAYGFDLGGNEFGWSFNYKPASRFRHVLDSNKFPGEAIENYLLAEYGFTEDPQIHVQGYWARRTAALIQHGINIVRYGSPEFPGYILSMPRLTFEVDDYGSLRINPPLITREQDRQLKEIYEKLSVIPKFDPDPSWTLAAFYG